MTVVPAPRILLVAAHYPPDPASGARRPWELVGVLRGAGFAVTVLTFADEAGEIVGAHGESVVRVPMPTSPLAHSASAGHAGDGPTPASSTGLLKRVRQSARRLLPGVAHQWAAWKLYPDAHDRGTRNLIEASRGRQCDLVYSTAPPMSVHLAAREIARSFDVPWVAEFRDPWADPATGRPAFAGTIVAPRANRDRRIIVQEPQATVGVSDGIVRWLESEGARRACVSRNGIPDRLLEAGASEAVRLQQIGYFGEFYNARTPVPFFDAVAALNDPTSPRPRITLQLVGDVTMFGDERVDLMLAARGLADQVQVSPRVPHPDAVRMMRECGVLLLLAQGQPRQVPNKLYEYLGVRRPILAWVDDEGESARILRDVGGHFLVTEHHTPDEITSIVAAALDAAPSWTPPHPEQLNAYASSSQLAKVVELISAVVAEERGI